MWKKLSKDGDVSLWLGDVVVGSQRGPGWTSGSATMLKRSWRGVV